MGKGDGRRVEDAAKIDANWQRAFGKKVDAHGPTWTDATPPGDADPLKGSDETRDAEIIVSYDEYRRLQREARISERLRVTLPLIYAQMEKELLEGWPL